MANILLVTHWTGGDVIPFVRMGMLLRRRGHRVRIFTHHVYEREAMNADLQFTSLDTAEAWASMTNDLALLSDPVMHIEDTIRFSKKYHGRNNILSEYEKISEYSIPGDTVVIGRHRSSVSALIAAEKHQLPVASVMLAPNYLSHLSLHEDLFGKMMAHEVNGARAEIGLGDIQSWTGWMCSPKRILGMWPEWFAPREADWPKSLLTLDFPIQFEERNQTLPDEVRLLLANGTKPVLITAGTSKMVKPEFYQVAQDACHRLGRPAILVAQHDELVPAHLNENVHVFRYLPIAEVMPYVSAVIHHGGIGTLSEAVRAGVPQLILPYYADRPDNAFRLSELGVAEFFPPALWEPAQISESMSRLLTPEFKMRCEALSRRACEGDAADSFCEAIEAMVGNSAYNMPTDFGGYVDEVSSVGSGEEAPRSSERKRQLLATILRQRSSA
ncbi:glycosyltransferase family 1 protein [Rhizobium leguminosarum]|uniref:glycosyltransferase n=1 Tax=Rhizobium leguminosarum TaxID=384 RepID=UPI001C98C90D|nr:glycosyltransferase [Rhizobium leguminosarum]MBY5768540.1 glycosyltransferase family 1 protein [Rhizobium leguminosarum]